MEFVPLYVRSEYSMLQSTCSICNLIKKAKELGIKSLAVTDEGVMHGTIKFYKECLSNNIKPIIGLHIPYTLNGTTSKILLYAMDTSGYRNLMKISSRFKVMKKPLDIEDLRKLSTGVLAITSGAESIIYSYLEKKNYQELNQHLSILESVYNNYLYIGLTATTNHDRDNLDSNYNELKKLNKKMVALQPIYFLSYDDSTAYQVLKSIANNGNLTELTERETNSYFYTQEEIEFLFSKYPDLINATTQIKNLCNIEITFNRLELPKYQDDIDASKYLLELSIAGLKKRLKSIINPDVNKYIERIKYEHQIIDKMGFADYFLIVWDYVKFAKQNNIYVGPGRGSAGASLIAYCLGITDVDPLKYNLLFERFLNPERVTMPDIDIDFQDDLRDEVIKYVGRKYGSGKVAHIATFGTFQIKLAINECARVFKLSESRMNQLSKHLNLEIKNEKHQNLSLEEVINKSSVLTQLMNEYEDIEKVLRTAIKIQGLPRNISTHAAGIIITKYNLVNYTPLDQGLDDIYQTQYEASDLESLGLLKMDFLGLKNLTNITKTIDLIKKDNINFTMPKVENDPAIFKMLADGDVIGIFQLESSGMMNLIKQLKTSSLDDIISALALYRPGPMEIIPTFIKRKFKQEKVIYPHPDLEEILKETYGTIVYQEQIMQIAVKFAGYTLGRADILRRAVSKKKKDVLEKEKQSFIESSVRLGYKEEVAENIYSYIVKFADYGFNKAHSVAYAKLAYQTAYLKYYYPTYYMSTLMTSFMGSANDILSYYKEAVKKNITVYPPSINQSSYEFSCYQGGILFPLTIIRGLGEVKTKELIKERYLSPFKSFKDFIIRTKDIIPLSVVHNLIYSGALDEFNLTKKTMIENAKLHIDLLDYEDIPGIIGVTYTEDEYPYGVLLEKEKEIMGLNIKYNFFIQYANIYKTKQLMYIKDAKENTQIKTLGIIHSIKEITTKNNELMAFAVLEDNISKIDITLFPRVYNRLTNLIDGSIVIVYGNVNMRNQLQIVVEDIQII